MGGASVVAGRGPTIPPLCGCSGSPGRASGSVVPGVPADGEGTWLPFGWIFPPPGRVAPVRSVPSWLTYLPSRSTKVPSMNPRPSMAGPGLPSLPTTCSVTSPGMGS